MKLSKPGLPFPLDLPIARPSALLGAQSLVYAHPRANWSLMIACSTCLRLESCDGFR